MVVRFSYNMPRLLGMIFGSLFFLFDASCCFQTAAFFPIKALQKGSSVLAIGVIVGCFDVAGIIACLSPTIFKMENVKVWFFAGAALRGLSTFCFGFTCYITDVIIYNITCGVTQGLMGAGCFLIWVCGVPYMVSLDPANAAMISALTQAMDALGGIFGPPSGSFLFSQGGFLLPFLVNGLSLFLSAGAAQAFVGNPSESIQSFVKKSSREKEDFEKPETSDVLQPLLGENPIVPKSFTNFILNPNIIMSALPFSLASVYYGYICVSLTPYLGENFGITGDTVGYYLLINTVTTVVMSALTGKLTDLGYGVILYSLVPLIVSGSFFAIFLPLEIPSLVTLKLFLPYLAVSGVFYSIASVTSFLVFEKAAVAENFRDMTKTKQYVATLWGLSFCIGRLFGSFVIGGAIFSKVGFYWTNFIIAAAALVSVVPSFATLWKLGILKKTFYTDLQD